MDQTKEWFQGVDNVAFLFYAFIHAPNSTD